jgi:uncharacterized membrane protein YkoI
MHPRLWPVALAALAIAYPAVSQERKIDETKLPASVRNTVAEQQKGATIKGFSTEVEHGKRVYEAEMLANGRTRDIEIAADGSVNEIEEEVSLESLPAAVQQALQKKANGGTITKVESLTRHGKLVAYEAAINRGGKHSEIQVGPQGI